MREPVFNETVQLGVVVAIGSDGTKVRGRLRDRPVGVGSDRPRRREQLPRVRSAGRRSNRIAIATVGGVMWELIEPLDEEGIYARFLAEKGEGVHHVAVATPDFDETVAGAERKDGLMLRCEHSGIDIAYLDTQRDLGVVLEVFSGMPSNGGDPDST